MLSIYQCQFVNVINASTLYFRVIGYYHFEVRNTRMHYDDEYLF